MTRLDVMFVAAILALAVFADNPYMDQIGGILRDVSSADRDVRLSATNKIDILMAAVSNSDETATCRLLKAKLRIECADIAGDASIYDPAAFADATNLCWSAMRDVGGDRLKWQFYGASLLLPRPLSMDGCFDDMFCIATNALSSTNVVNSVCFDTNVWHALFGRTVLNTEDASTAFRVLAASSLLLTDRSADIAVYTNGLSQAGIDALAGLLAR